MSTARNGSTWRAALLAAVLATGLTAACTVSPAIASDDDKAAAQRPAQPRKAQGKARSAEKTDKTKEVREQAKATDPTPCAGLKGLPLAQCQKCDVPGKSDTMRFLCREGVAVTYCVKNAFKGSDPDCRANEPTNPQNL